MRFLQSCNRLRSVAPFAALVVAALVAGCASFDPYNTISRREVSTLSLRDEQLTPPTAEAIRAARVATVDYVWTTIRDRYYRADLNGVDWAAAKARWAPLIIDAPNENTYWALLDRMAAELKDSHTRVESPIQVEARRQQRVLTLGVNFRELAGALIATSVNVDSDAYFAGLRPGMLITQIGSRPALTQWREWVAQARPSSSPQATRRGALRALNDVARDNPQGVMVEFERADGEKITATLKRRNAITRPLVASRILPSGVGYVRLTAFSESLRSELFSALDAVKSAPGLVLDLRGNGGGSGSLSNALVGYFFKTKTGIGRATTRNNTPVTVAFGAVQVVALDRSVPGRADAYAGKVVVLIDNYSASASEIVASTLKATGRAVIVGETSCGCLLAFLGYAQLNQGGELAYSEVGFLDLAGQAVENVGVAPNVEILPNAFDLQTQRDRALEAAVLQAL